MTMFGAKTLAAAVVGAGALVAGPALAVTVTNQSDKAHEITVDLGSEEPKTKIDAGKSATVDCPDGCEVRGGPFAYGLAATKGDKIVIGKDGMLAYEGQATSTEARNDDGKKAQ
ncbi:hypothetical protein ACFSCV_01940 [Methylopila henanensis]|uniref:Uncharacterized protein n=1 Tax=Methylopila henanensis TaxID=873516 RepID=A0ABW4K3D4_9HYPH